MFLQHSALISIRRVHRNCLFTWVSLLLATSIANLSGFLPSAAGVLCALGSGMLLYSGFALASATAQEFHSFYVKFLGLGIPHLKIV